MDLTTNIKKKKSILGLTSYKDKCPAGVSLRTHFQISLESLTYSNKKNGKNKTPNFISFFTKKKQILLRC